MRNSHNIILAGAIAGLFTAAPSAFAHQYYNLTGAGANGTSGATAGSIGLGLVNSLNGTDGVSANSNGTSRTTDGTTAYNAVTNNTIPGTGTPASVTEELAGNLPYNWYAGHHSYADGWTKREQWTGASSTANVGPLMNAGPLPTLPNGLVLPGTAANWGTAAAPNATLNPGSLWAAYTTRNTAASSTYKDALVDPSATLDAMGTAMDRPYLAVLGNSSSTGQGMDYGLIHVSCGGNSATVNCASKGDILTTITIKNDSQYSQYNGLLDVALYRGADTSLTSNRNAAYSLGDTNPQGSNLGEAIWTASMSSTSDLLFYKFVFNQSEWAATDTNANGAHTNGFYTLLITAHCAAGDTECNAGKTAVMYDVLTTTSAVPVPASVWLLGSALSVFGWARRRTQAA